MNKETDESIKENILLPSFFNPFFLFFNAGKDERRVLEAISNQKWECLGENLSRRSL